MKSNTSRAAPFRLDPKDPAKLRLRGVAERLLFLDRLQEIYESLPPGLDPLGFVERALEHTRVDVRIPDGELERIPREGPVIVVANHPLGGLDGLALGSALFRARPDGKLIVNRVLERIPELAPAMISVDPFANRTSRSANALGIREAIRHLNAGGALGMFPAGEVSHASWSNPRVADGPWNESVAFLQARTDATVVPLFVDGRNGLLFQLAGLIHPLLRTALLPRELVRRTGTPLHLRIGTAIGPQLLAALGGAREVTTYLRERTYLLREAGGPDRVARRPKRRIAPVAPPVPAEVIEQEIESLGRGGVLVESGSKLVVQARGIELPRTLEEIGRLRELTFRAAGEGSGRPLDLDAYDPMYRHLFVYDRDERAILGAYRLGATEEVLAGGEGPGLYTSELFHLDARLPDRLRPALELGRSFVVAEHQRRPASLMLLWRGIGEFLVAHPQYRMLFGALSISDDYSSVSRRLMAEFLLQHSADRRLCDLVGARNPFEKRRRVPGRARRRSPSCAPRSLEHLSSEIRETEGGKRDIPVLLREYLRLGARCLGLTVDPAFGYTLDALVLVDLDQAPVRLLERYMTPEGASAFLAAAPAHGAFEAVA